MDRLLIPGSEWLYFKLYTGKKSADNLLQYIYPYLLSLKKDCIIRQFFFIRYSDPHFHLRLRLHLSENKDFSKILLSLYDLFKSAIEDGTLWNLQIDTYKREIERYGITTMEFSEAIFCIDSDAIIKLIKSLNHNERELHRWLLALLLIDDILSASNCDIAHKKEVLMIISQSFKHEFRFTTHAYKKQLDTKYRNSKEMIFSVLDNRNNSPVQPYIHILNERSYLMSLSIKQITEIEHDNAAITSLLKSFIHMTMNRLFRSHNRLHEMVLYDFLYRYYESTIARSRDGKLV